MRTTSLINVFVSFGLLTFVSCQEDRIIFNESPLTPVTKSGDLATVISESDTIMISKWGALKIAEPITNKYPDRWVDISNEIIPANSKIEYSTYGLKEKEEHALFFDSPSFDSWLLVVGPNLAINGRQTRLHIFVNVNNGEVVQKWINGLAVIEWDTSTEISIKNESEIHLREKTAPSPSRTSPTKWAVILSGGINKNENHMRYWNDCRLAYTTLTQELNYPTNHIYCLVSDGTNSADDRLIGYKTYDSSPLDFDNDGYIDIDYSATKANISTVFSTLGNLVSDGDEVLVFVTDHGDRINNTSYICLWGGEIMSPVEFMCELLKLGTGVSIDVVLGQCYSGGFRSLLDWKKTTIVTSCGATEESTGCPFFGVSVYDYFLYYWTEAIHSINPYSSGTYSNGDGYLSSFEIFKYAKSHTQADPNVLGETPLLNLNGPDAFSWGHDLEGNNYVPYIIGSDYASNNSNSLYSLSGLPSSYSRSWIISNDLSIVTSDSNSITVTGNITSPSQFVSQNNNNVTARFSDLGETIDIKKKIVSVWNPGYYFNQNHIHGVNGVYCIGGDMWTGSYGYDWVSGNDAWQIISQSDNVVFISEGYTLDPVPLIVSFYDPLGEFIFVYDEVQ